MENKVKIKDSIYVLEEDRDHYSFVFTATRRIKKFAVDSLVKDLISKLDSEQLEKNLINDLSKKYSEKDINSCINSLEKNEILRRYNGEEINKRYSKQILFIDELTKSWEETLELQKRIETSKIAVFGVGGIGTWIVNGLYQMGVGEIRITDPDIIEESNLNRQLFFDSGDLWKYKTDVIKSKLKDANIIQFKKRVSESEDLEEIIEGCNFLVNCADNPSIEETTKIIDGYAVKHGIPYSVAGGYNMHLGMVGPIIVPGKTKTFREFIESQKEKDPLKHLKKIKDIKQTGNLGSIAGTIANFQTNEIFKYLIGKGSLNINKFTEIDFMNQSISWTDF